jgi:hypothetical protein
MLGRGKNPAAPSGQTYARDLDPRHLQEEIEEIRADHKSMQELRDDQWWKVLENLNKAQMMVEDQHLKQRKKIEELEAQEELWYNELWDEMDDLTAQTCTKTELKTKVDAMVLNVQKYEHQFRDRQSRSSRAIKDCLSSRINFLEIRLRGLYGNNIPFSVEDLSGTEQEDSLFKASSDELNESSSLSGEGSDSDDKPTNEEKVSSPVPVWATLAQDSTPSSPVQSAEDIDTSP